MCDISLQGNPHYQSQVYKALVALLSSTSSVAQRMAAYTLRLIQVHTLLLEYANELVKNSLVPSPPPQLSLLAACTACSMHNMLLYDCGVILDIHVASELYSIERFGHVDLRQQMKVYADKGLRDRNVQSNKVLMLCQAQQ